MNTYSQTLYKVKKRKKWHWWNKPRSRSFAIVTSKSSWFQTTWYFRLGQCGLDDTVDGCVSGATTGLLPAAQTMYVLHSSRLAAAPQIQSCGVHSGAPRRRDTAMRIDVLSRRVPTEDIGMAYRNAPEDCAAAAIRRARLAWVWAADKTASEAITCRGRLHIFWLVAIDASGVGNMVIDCHWPMSTQWLYLTSLVPPSCVNDDVTSMSRVTM